MNKKILLSIMYTFIVIIVLVVLIFMLNPLTKSDEQIRDNLLESTPIGTHMDDVIKYIEGQRKWEVVYISNKQGFIKRGFRDEVGEKSIRIKLGSYGFIFTTSVSVFWGFDENSELIEIWVRKTIDAL